jgi:uncharacterized protein YgfB (UPF0149 family)
MRVTDINLTPGWQRDADADVEWIAVLMMGIGCAHDDAASGSASEALFDFRKIGLDEIAQIIGGFYAV